MSRVTKQLKKFSLSSLLGDGRSSDKDDVHMKKVHHNDTRKRLPSIPTQEEQSSMKQSIRMRSPINTDHLTAYGPFFLEYSMLAEFNHLRKQRLPGVYVIPSYSNPLVWHGVIFIRNGVYQDGVFKFTLEVPSNYPDGDCPTVQFVQQIFHPAIDPETGELDVKRAFKSWRPNVNHLWQVLLYVRRVFYKIETASPMNIKAAKMFENNQDEFKEQVRKDVEESHKLAANFDIEKESHEIKFAEWNEEVHGTVLKGILGEQNNCIEEKTEPEPRIADMEPKPKMSGLSFMESGSIVIFSKEEQRSGSRILNESVTSTMKEPSFLKYLDPTGDPSFWKEVEENWQQNPNEERSDLNHVLNERRAARIIEEFCSTKEDDEYRNPVVMMISDWYEEYHSNPNSKDWIEFPMFEREVSVIAQTVISLEYSSMKDGSGLCRLSQHNVVDIASGITKTLLHAIADGNRAVQQCTQTYSSSTHCRKTLSPIAKCLLRYEPSLVYATTEGEDWEKLPVELALLNFDDDMAALLINSMKEKERARSLFQYDYSRKTTARFKLIDYIDKPDMQKTVMAVLDSLVSPHMKMPLSTGLELSCFPGQQYRYHFRILDGDLEGKCNFGCGDGKANWTQMSCLQALCLSNFNKIAIEHPVVRLLARRKWEAYGRFHVRLHLSLYLAFLILMSFSLIGHQFSTVGKRGIGALVFTCDIMSIIFCIAYLGIEADQFRREKLHYLIDVYNYLDVFGICCLLLTILLLWMNTKEPELASCAFLLNYLRLFKFLSAFRSSGVYLATLSILIRKNLPVFFAVYSVLLTAFSGACFIAINRKPNISLPDVILRGVRGFTEGQAFAESYDNFSAFAIIIILGGTLTTSLILANVLIAQLSESYAVSKSNAILHYDIAKLKFVTRMENSRFKCLNLRLKYYKDSTLSSEEEIFASETNVLFHSA